MNLGWCDVCLRVKDVITSRNFYADLGFWRVEGEDGEGWAVVTNGEQRLGLFEPQYMSTPMSLNFRGGDVKSICDELEAKGRLLSGTPKFSSKGGSASLQDPDGNLIFLDSVSGETKLTEPLP